MLVKRRNGETQSDLEWQRLRDLFDRCRADDDAEEAICFHGVAALLAEREADYELALEHRMIEIDKINWLHQEEARNPTDGFQTQNYESVDLELRHEIVRDLKRRQ